MKKFMKLLIATALIATMAVCFAACGGKTMNTAIVYEEDPVAVATKTGYLSDFDDKKIVKIQLGEDWDDELQQLVPVYDVQAKGEWIVFYEDTYAFKTEGGNQVPDVENDTRTYTLYNVATEKVVAEKTMKKESSGSGYKFPSTPYRVMEVLDGEYSVGVYTDKGDSTIFYGENKLEVGAASITERPNVGLVDVGDYIFKMVDGEVSYVKNETASISSIDEYVVDEDGNVYYYDLQLSGIHSGITVYDANLNLYGYVRVPSYAEDTDAYVLSNGNVLIQYEYYTDMYSDDYEIIEDGYEKSNLVSVLYNLEKNTAKEIKLDYDVEGVGTKGLAEKVDNLAVVYAIEDNRINEYPEAAIYCELTNNGKVGTIYGKAEDYLVNAGLYAVAADRFIGISITGEQILYNEEMEKLATFSKDAYPNEQYIVDGEKYYNFDGSLIVDLAKYTKVKTFSNGNVMFKEVDNLNNESDYYLLANGTYSVIATDYTGENVKNNKNGDKEVKSVDADTFLGEPNDEYDYYVITERTVTEKDSVEVTTFVDTVYNMNGEKLTETVAYESAPNAERKATIITDRQVKLASEGLLVFSVSVLKYDESKDKDDNVIGYGEYDFVTEYYVCK